MEFRSLPGSEASESSEEKEISEGPWPKGEAGGTHAELLYPIEEQELVEEGEKEMVTS